MTIQQLFKWGSVQSSISSYSVAFNWNVIPQRAFSTSTSEEFPAIWGEERVQRSEAWMLQTLPAPLQFGNSNVCLACLWNAKTGLIWFGGRGEKTDIPNISPRAEVWLLQSRSSANFWYFPNLLQPLASFDQTDLGNFKTLDFGHSSSWLILHFSFRWPSVQPNLSSRKKTLMSFSSR